MKKLTNALQQEFFRVLNLDLPIHNFQQWVYHNSQLEKELESTYLELISLNFNDSHFLHELNELISPFLDLNQFEEWKLRTLLNDLISKNEHFARSLIKTYDLYCAGYYFLENLAIGYGLIFANAFFNYKDWESLEAGEKASKIDEVYDKVRREAAVINQFLDQGKIQLLYSAKQNRYNFIDKRSMSDKLNRTTNTPQQPGLRQSFKLWMHRRQAAKLVHKDKSTGLWDNLIKRVTEKRRR